MLTERIWSGNSLRNFHYLVACAETGEALAVDPLEWRLCLDAARRRGWQITQILNTHEHDDHTGGNAGSKAATGARVLAHAGAAARIGGVDRGLARGDVIRVGRTRRARVPRHAGTHHDARVPAVAYATSRRCSAATRSSTRAPATATTAGDPHALYDTFVTQLARLPDETRVYPGPRIPGPQPRVHPRPRAGQPGRRSAPPSARSHEPAAALGHHARRGEAHQQLSSACRARRSSPGCARRFRTCRAARCAHRVRQAARTAQPLVTGLKGPKRMQSSFYRRTFQLTTAAILGYALYQIIVPLREEIGWAAVLAFILHPLHERLSRAAQGPTARCPPGSSPPSRPSWCWRRSSVLGVVFAGQVARLIAVPAQRQPAVLHRAGRPPVPATR